MEIIERKVKPDRDKLANNPDGRRREQFWWQWGRSTPALFSVMRDLPRMLARSLTSKHFCFAFVEKPGVLDQTLIAFALSSCSPFAISSCRIHDLWSLFFGATLGSYRIDTRAWR